MDPIRRLSWAALLLAGLTLVCLLAPTPALAQKSDSKVKITAEVSKPDAEGKQVVTLNLTIEKGWHLYANPIGNKDLESAQTKVTLKGGQELKDVKIEYPVGKVHKDSVVGDYSVYEGSVVIKAQVRRASGDASPLEASVAIQSCNDKTCLLPATVKVPVK